MSNFAETLKRIRVSKGMTQEEFADFLGTSKQNISRYEKGEVSPKISTASDMANKLGITLAQLNGDDSSEKKYAPLENVNAEREELIRLFSLLPSDVQHQVLDLVRTLSKAHGGS